MSLGVVSMSAELPSTRRLLEAAHALGVEARRIDPFATVVRTGCGAPAILEQGRPLPAPTHAIVRLGSTLTAWGLALHDALVRAGARSPATTEALRIAADQLATLERLDSAGLPTLPTVAVREASQLEIALDAVGGPPVVLKLLHGSQGMGVMAASDLETARSVLGALCGLGQLVLVQRRVVCHPARDLRVLVVGGEPIAACWRVAAQGEFRTNLHRGGHAECATLDAALSDLARRAAAAVGLPLCGVDLIEDRDGWAVLEVNGSPGLEGIERATGRDLATEVVRSVIAL